MPESKRETSPEARPEARHGTVPEARPGAIWRGKIAVFETPDGGAVLAYRAEGDTADAHHPIPAAMWSVMGAALRGEPVDLNPLKLMKLLMGGR